MSPTTAWAGSFVTAVTAVTAVAVLVPGVWALFAPQSFAEAVNFAEHEHFLHDVGAFQIGIGVTLLLALFWSDALVTVLGGFFVANTIHTVNHVTDLDHGGSWLQAVALGALSVLVAAAFAVRFQQHGRT